jgi:hypothetical protein
MVRNEYAKSVFINCPFDSQYKPLFEGIVFATSCCGLKPRCTLVAKSLTESGNSILQIGDDLDT